MLTRLEIENFQSHRKTTLELVPGTNVLIGESDAGKSAVIRALYWLLFNRPLGDSFRSEWGGDTRVAVHTSDGHVVERVRTASRNEYILDGCVLNAFGADVPEEVSNVLKMDVYNVQSQMDVPFLLAMAPGEATRLLNKAASIDEIDVVTSSLRRSLNAVRNRIQVNESQLTTYRAKLQQYDHLPAVEEALAQAEKLGSEYERRAVARDMLQRVVLRAAALERGLARTEHVPQLISACQQLEKLVQAHRAGQERWSRLASIVSKSRSITTYLSRTEVTGAALSRLNEIEQLRNRWQELSRRKDALSNLVLSAKTAQAKLLQLNQEVTRLEEEYHKIAPEICPLCGGKMK